MMLNLQSLCSRTQLCHLQLEVRRSFSTLYNYHKDQLSALTPWCWWLACASQWHTVLARLRREHKVTKCFRTILTLPVTFNSMGGKRSPRQHLHIKPGGCGLAPYVAAGLPWRRCVCLWSSRTEELPACWWRTLVTQAEQEELPFVRKHYSAPGVCSLQVSAASHTCMCRQCVCAHMPECVCVRGRSMQRRGRM